jgi:leucyl/phenylalanyl-tRNA---protein transferase
VIGRLESRFPDAASAPADEPLAQGGDLEPATLIDAYAHGIFPWPTGFGRLLWWSPDPRAVFPLDGLHISRSLRRTLRSGRFTCTLDTDFAGVIRGCADRPGQGTWINRAMVRAYQRLHELGVAHSVEVRDRSTGDLAGGIYGVALGGAFMGESMFSRATDASKVAVVDLVERLRACGFTLFDAQLPTPHLTSLGAVAVPRREFLRMLEAAIAEPAVLRSASG